MVPVRLTLALVILALVALVLGLSYYTPPLLREEPGSLMAKPFDFLGFVWHHNRAFWYEAMGDSDRANCELLLSGQYRPTFLARQATGPLNFGEISAEFELCGEYWVAAQVLARSLYQEEALAEDWAHLGRLYLKAKAYGRAIQALETAIEKEDLRPDTFEDLARAHEKSGQTPQALRRFREALARDDSRFWSLAGLERLGTAPEKQMARARMQELTTRELNPRDMVGETGEAVTGGWTLWRNGSLRAEANLLAGEVIIRVRARGSFAGADWPIMVVTLGVRELGKVKVARESWDTYDFKLDVPETGSYSLRIGFVNDYFDGVTKQDRNLYLSSVIFVSS